jgi:hypothetical protein
MRSPFRHRELAAGIVAGLLLAALSGAGFHRPQPAGGFSFNLDTTVPGTPEEIFDALTGNIGGWWDHTVSESPLRLYIEPKPGGGFFERFDESGDGVRHAVVTAASRGELLRFEGPLGLAGNALLMVHTYELKPVGTGSTHLTVTVRATGEVQEGWAEAVEGVWHHFIDERFVPYIESGRHRDAGR